MEHIVINSDSFCKIIVEVHYFLGSILTLKSTKLVILVHYNEYGV